MYNNYRTFPYGYYEDEQDESQQPMYNDQRSWQCPFMTNSGMYNPYTPDNNSTESDMRFAPPRPPMMDPITLKDYGPMPYVVNINQATRQNTNFRTVLWTGKHLQVTLMSIKVGDDIGLEIHPNVDQFIRIESGQGIVRMGKSKDRLDFQASVYDDIAIMIPAGTWHNVINTGNRPLKVYSIYAPPNHPRDRVDVNKPAK